MAGGDNAKLHWCMVCGAKAERIYEGDESDEYKCERGHKFSIDWQGKPPPAPQWPPPPEMKPYLEQLRKGAR